MRVHGAKIHRCVVVALVAVVASLAACADDRSAAYSGQARDSGSLAPREIAAEAGGEVARDSSEKPLRWLNDANALALASAMNGKELAAADAELSTWHVDTVRAFAAEMAREHSALQRSIDSAADAFRLVPAAPALGSLVQARMQRQLDSVYAHGGKAFDRAYVEQQVASHQLMHEYLVRLAAVAERPGVRDVLSTLADSVQSQMARATAMRVIFAKADSVAADSAAARAARAARRKARLAPGGGR